MQLSRDRIDLFLTGITVLATLAGMAAQFSGAAPMIALAAFGLAYLAGGVPAGLSALGALVHERVLDIDLLMVVAALAAAAVGAPLEGAVLLALFSLSGTLEHRAMGKARRAVEALMQLRPDRALRRNGEAVEEVATADLRPGDVVVLRPGARVPVDGRVVLGAGSMDESTITGESMPVSKGPGALVHEATVNLNAVLEVEVIRSVADSTVAQMIRLVTEAQAARAPSEQFSDWFGQRYTVAVLAGSVLAFGVFLWLGFDARAALYKAATLLVAASPCAVVISVPAAILSALSAAARGGVLFKGGAALETLASVRAFAFDKTGTLTTGKAEVRRVMVPDRDEKGFLALLAGIEAHAEHPIAGAIRDEAAARGIAPVPVTGVVAHPSEGLTADGGLWAGNRRMLARMAADGDAAELAGFDEASETVVWMGRGAQVLGAAAVADLPRGSSAPGLAALRAGGLAELAMMTGDRRPVALRIAGELGLREDEVHADLLPGDKVRLIAGLAEKGPVAYVGDGVNDAAALARADVGVAMGAAGSEVALQAAGVVLMSDDMTRLAEAHRLARRTAAIIRQNLAFALGAMALLVMGALFWDLPLPLAVIGHEGGTVLVVLNGLRLLADPIRRPGKPG
ncbi:MAG: heavy metal translocating P-type ATPase [Gemmobacter sp.]|uniref:heavy metal translocating P-type ATPase n=1 Tax=Gemmobacter sp. TaxID=1898957 RepID=UPI00391AFD55